MKPTFIRVVFAGLLSAGCVSYDLPPPHGGEEDESEVGESSGTQETGGCDTDDCESAEHDLSGELILFVNARLSDESAAFQAHLPLDEAGTYMGNALYLYDPTRECEDAGNACRMAKVGHLRLDESLGPISVADNSLRKFVVRDLAWSPARGLWAATFDSLNDEWSISTLEVDDWMRTDNLVGVQRWVIPPGAAESPSTDPCYWFEAVSGLGFAGDELLLGVRGAGSKGLIADGSLLRIDTQVLEQGHCVHPSDISQDPLYYACEVVCEQTCSFGDKVGVAGDVISALDQSGASAWLRSEDENVMPLARNEMSTCAPSEPGEVVEGVLDNVFIEDVVRGDEIDGLARVGGKLYGISVLGKVYEIDEVERIVTQIDDLGPLFPEQGLRVRGATEILVTTP
jgi:hypothetical protein